MDCVARTLAPSGFDSINYSNIRLRTGVNNTRHRRVATDLSPIEIAW
jgi:hypothetical protein